MNASRFFYTMLAVILQSGTDSCPVGAYLETTTVETAEFGLTLGERAVIAACAVNTVKQKRTGI
jgi:hypothetical protein